MYKQDQTLQNMLPKLNRANLCEKTTHCTQYYKNWSDEYIRTQIRLIVTIIYDENVSPSETDCSVIKVSHIASFTSAHDKFLMENNSKTVKGGGGQGNGGGGSTVQTGRSIFFLRSFAKSRPIEILRKLPPQNVSLKPPKMSSHFGVSSKARWK